jgi:putative ABC transport system permease protein
MPEHRQTQIGWAAPLRYAFRRLRHGWRGRGAALLVAAVAVAVASAGAVGLFTERLRIALTEQTGDTLGADALITSRQPIPAALIIAAAEAELAVSTHVTLPSVVFHGDDASSLASIKAVSPEYPLRGIPRVTDVPFGDETPAQGVPEPGTAWVDPRLWSELGLSSGSMVQVGAVELRVSQVLAFEPDRGSGFTDLAPRLLISLDDLERANLLGPGARASHSLQVAGSTAGLAQLRAQVEEQGLRWVTPQDARPEIAAALDRAGQFLDLAVICALVLAAAATMIAAHGFGGHLRQEAALLKCLGASRQFVARALLGLLLMLGLLGGGIGLLFAYGGQALIAGLAATLVGTELPPPPLAPALRALALGGVLMAGFAAPPVLAVRRQSPMQVFQQVPAALALGGWLTRLVALLALVGIVWLQARSLDLTLAVLGGGAAVALLLYGMGMALLRLLDGARHSGFAGAAWRLGLANLSRRRRSISGQAAALGLVLLALLLLATARGDLLEQWRSGLPEGTPNVFLINVQGEQLDDINRFFAERDRQPPELWPMARARLVGVNGEAVSVDDYDDPETQRWINRDFNISWSEHLPADNTLTDGRWWTPDELDQPLLSATDYAVERLDLKLGDTLTLRFADTDVVLTVHNLREVRWDNFQPNFFLLTPPVVLAERGVPATWLTSFHLAQGDRGVLRELVMEFPNITAIDIDAVLAQVRSIIDRVVRAVEFLFLFALAAGLLVLLAAIEASREERVREVALLRTLGAPRRLIAQALLTEYGLLGAVAGLIAAMAAQGVTWALAVKVFEIDYQPGLGLWLLGTGGGALLVSALGWMALRRVTHTPPDRVLRMG